MNRKQFFVTTMEDLVVKTPPASLWDFMGADSELWFPEFLDESKITDYESAVDQKTYKWLIKALQPSVEKLYRLFPGLKFKNF